MIRGLFQKLYSRINKLILIGKYPFRPRLSVIILSWNRDLLFKQTLYSLLTNSKNYLSEIIIIDNNSNKALTDWISHFQLIHPNIKTIFLDKNIGGLAINKGLSIATGKYIFIAENDLEFLPHWDVKMLEYFKHHPNLGQLSPFSPFPEESRGEIWSIKKFHKKLIHNFNFNTAEQNLGTSCMIPRKIIELGIRFGSLESQNSEFLFPSDAQFSNDIRKKGFEIAWANEYHVINWGHNQSIWKAFPDYFSKNFTVKKDYSIDGLTAENSIELVMQKNESLVKKLEYIKSLNIVPENNWQEINYFETTHLYIDTGLGFQEQNKINLPLIKKRNQINLIFDIKTNQRIYNFRWDPVEGLNCQIENLEIKLVSDGAKIDVISDYESNAEVKEVYKLTFNNADPFIAFKNSSDKPKQIIISGKINFIYNKS